MFNDIFLWNERQRNRMSGKRATRIFECTEIWRRTLVTHCSWSWEEMVLHQRRQSTWNIWDKFVEGMLLEIRSRFGNVRDSFSHSSLCKPAQSLPSSRRDMKSMNPSTTERSDPLWWDNQVPQWCSVWSRQKVLLDCDDPANEKIYCNKHGERIEKFSPHEKLSKFCMDAWFLSVVENGQFSWRKTLKDSYNSQMQQVVVSTRRQETRKHLDEKVGSEGTPKLWPYWKSQLVTFTVNMELRSEFGLWSETKLTLGSDFLMDPIICDEFELQWNKFQKCMPIECKGKTTKKRTCWLFTENRSHWNKELDWHWTREIFFLRFWGIEESNASSSSFTTSASRRRWSGSFSREWKNIFRTNVHNLSIGLTVDGKHAWCCMAIRYTSSFGGFGGQPRLWSTGRMVRGK